MLTYNVIIPNCLLKNSVYYSNTSTFVDIIQIWETVSSTVYVYFCLYIGIYYISNKIKKY